MGIVKELNLDIKRLQHKRSYAIEQRSNWNKTVESYDLEIKFLMEKLAILRNEGKKC